MSKYHPVEVMGVRIEMPSNQPIVLLKEISGTRYLPIWVGTVEATAIAFAEQKLKPARPLTHDLVVDLIAATENKLRSVHITKVENGIFYADIVLTNSKSEEIKVSARPSDAIAIAIRTGATILASEELIAEVGIDLPETGEDEIEKFKEFLDEVSPEDFA